MSHVAEAQSPERPDIPEVTGPVDLVVLICGEPADREYNELRFVLRSFAANFASLGRVFIIGTNVPPWLQLDQVVHMAIPDRPGSWGMKAYNIINKINAACANGLSRHFIFGSDDQFVLRPSTPADFWPREEGHVATWTQEQWDRVTVRLGKGKGPPMKERVFFRYMKHTAAALVAHGKDVYNFDSHHPVLMDSALFPKVAAEYGFHEPTSPGEQLFLVNTLYFNAIGAKPLRAADSHRSSRETPPRNARFWNVNQHRFWAEAMLQLRRRFPDPSRFEDPFTPAVPEPVEEYAYSPDSAGEFLAERCLTDAALSVESPTLLVAYNEWARLRGLPPVNAVVFGERLRARGFKKQGPSWQGLGLRDPPAQPAQEETAAA